MQKKVLNFNEQVNKLNTVYGGKINVNITARRTFEAVFSVAESNRNKLFTFITTENNYAKYGAYVVGALKKADVNPSVLLVNEVDLSSENKADLSSLQEVIILGDVNLINYVCKNAQTANCHAILTCPYFEGLFHEVLNSYNNENSYNKNLKTLILDKATINKSSETDVAFSFIKTASKLISLIDYKYALLIGEKKYNKQYYDAVRLAVTLAINANTFENEIEVLAYSSLLIEIVFALSNVLTGGGDDLIFNALKLCYKNGDHGNMAYISFDRAVKLYYAFFVNDLTDLISVANYVSDVNLLSETANAPANEFLQNLKIPSENRYKLLRKLIDVTRSGFLKEVTEVLTSLKGIKNTYLKYKNVPENNVAVKYAILKNAITVAPYLSKTTSILTLMRDFGVLNTAK